MKNFFSLRLPWGMYLHYAKGRKILESIPGYSKGLVHYNRRRKPVGKMIRSFLGEPNHYDLQGHCVGYSRPAGRGKVMHYNQDGNCVGYTYSICKVLFVHRFDAKLF